MTLPTIRLFVSDMDSTMIANECIDEMARMLDEKKPVAGEPQHYFSQVQAITKATMEGAALPFNESLKQRIGILAAGGFKRTWLDEIYPRVTPMAGAADLLAYLNANHVHSVLVSGGFTFFAEKVAARLGFKEFHANILEFDGDGPESTLGAVHGPAANGGNILDGAGKLNIMLSIMKDKKIAPEAVCAIGDGSNDADMVREAGYGIAFNAKNPILLAAANHKVRSLSEVVDILSRPCVHR